jgi:hypothetical protein
MTRRLYYNPASATKDPRKGLGYGKGQKTPSFGTGVGSERSMGSLKTGIYAEPVYDIEEEEEDLEFDSKKETDRFVKMINKKVVDPDPTFWPRADRGSLGSTSIGWALGGLGAVGIGEATIPAPKGERLPKASKSISPFSHRILYPGGFSGPPLGSGDANQAFKTTGPYRRTGTQYGTSRAPTYDPAAEKLFIDRYQDIINLDPDERSILKQKLKIMKLLSRIDEIEGESADVT